LAKKWGAGTSRRGLSKSTVFPEGALQTRKGKRKDKIRSLLRGKEKNTIATTKREMQRKRKGKKRRNDKGM
jgi:hypothetical protein